LSGPPVLLIVVPFEGSPSMRLHGLRVEGDAERFLTLLAPALARALEGVAAELSTRHQPCAE
jgi:hypothetical protein